MRALFALICLFALTATMPASAQVLDLSTVKCKDFVESGERNISLILMWIQGYYTEEDDPPLIDFDKMAENGKKLGEYCGKNPSAGLITAADEVLK
ncbi:MAG: HdeA/HdeB family chaperone [Variibacter sp.]